jgi:hypothetical protein
MRIFSCRCNGMDCRCGDDLIDGEPIRGNPFSVLNEQINTLWAVLERRQDRLDRIENLNRAISQN